MLTCGIIYGAILKDIKDRPYVPFEGDKGCLGDTRPGRSPDGYSNPSF